MDRRKIIIMVVMLGVLVWAVTTSPLTKRLFGRSSTPARPAPVVGALAPLTASPPRSGAGSGSVPGAPVTPLSPAEMAALQKRDTAPWARDPFFTAAEERELAKAKVVSVPVQPLAPLPSYTVKTILISGTEKVATLDGRPVGEGDVIGEERVVEIRADAVVLERAGQRRRVLLPGGGVPIHDAGSSPVRAP
jgi:hypothetical protein